jgi:hypothetical protein
MTSLNSAMPEAGFDPWNFRPDVAVEVQGAKLTGCKVEAIDGPVGTVETCSLNPDDSYLVVSTGRLFGKKLHLPAGTVNHVDTSERRIYVDRSKSQIKGAPEVKPEVSDEPMNRQTLAEYYQQTYHS